MLTRRLIAYQIYAFLTINDVEKRACGVHDLLHMELRNDSLKMFDQPGEEINNCTSFACSVTRSTTTEFQHNDIMMKTTVQNDLRLGMALESMWIVCAREKSNN